MSKDLTVGFLLDFYGQLLTDKQRDSLDLYYNEDLSLAEIAEHTGITRQGVRDSIKRGESRLYEYENALGLAGRFANISEQAEKIIDALDKTDMSDFSEKTKRVMDKIQRTALKIKEDL